MLLAIKRLAKLVGKAHPLTSLAAPRKVTLAHNNLQARSQGIRKGGYILRGSGGAPPENF